ncbi:uncharacterized protein LOC128278797 [Anopheles cruzii]|uniref:uncharacterized protein LOC128278797 n=1 Tax=Anopheles cruzii TaxID=68878 RepID=UPI0022EC5725|nr:uncharacterized protein LOC128278797 [Anopheles cruzii]
METERKISQARFELQAVACKPTGNAEERYRVLEAKDRYLRLTIPRPTDIRKAKSIQGTCPDMCPEKERYLREWKGLVSSYEKLLFAPGQAVQIDHDKAIKQYSRSSADQELPLPHELRTEQALGRTMRFLLEHLADRCDEEPEGTNVSDWYHYIWDRTRGVRKDITQQDLCTPGVVELMEQCTRFHIHCAARLVAEDPSVFDQKINTENMTKCLQTLKYMYTDLAAQGARSPNEAEFRAYMVLLYLNDGNFLWELRQHAASGIVHSPEVQFALTVYFALDQNNHVRFFELVRSTTYMNACLLLRYFTQMRLKALDVLRKAYAVRSMAEFSVQRLTEMLCFESETELVAFCEHYGIAVDRASGIVQLESRHLYHPDTPYPARREMLLVESKRTGQTVGDAICGAPLATWCARYPCQPVYDSFDQEGYLLDELLQDVMSTSESQGANQAEQNKPTSNGITSRIDLPQKMQMVHEAANGTPTTDIRGNGNHSSSERQESQHQRDEHVFKVPSSIISFPRVRTPSLSPPLPGSRVALPAIRPINLHPTSPSNTSMAHAPATPEPPFVMHQASTFTPIGDRNSSCSAVTMPYLSPPNDHSIKAAGQKRTFFGATIPVQQPPAQNETAPERNIFTSHNSASVWTANSSGSIFGSVPYGEDKQFPSSQTASTASNEQSGIFEKSLPRNEFKNHVSDEDKFVSLDGPFKTHQGATDTDEDEMDEQDYDEDLQPEEDTDAYDVVDWNAEEDADEDEYEKEWSDQDESEDVESHTTEREERDSPIDDTAMDMSVERIFNRLVDDEVTVLAEQVTERCRHQQQCAEKLLLELTNELLKEHVASVVPSELQRMQKTTALHNAQLVLKYCKRWKKRAVFLRKQRSLMESVTPVFGPEPVIMVGAERVQEVLSQKVEQPWPSAAKHSKIDPLALLEEATQTTGYFLDSYCSPHFFKIVISVPDTGIDREANLWQRWLLERVFDAPEETRSRGCFYLATRNHTEPLPGVAVCMRLMCGTNVVDTTVTNGAKALDRSNGVLFVVAENRLEEARQRLRYIVASQSYKCPPRGTQPPPLVVFFQRLTDGPSPNAEQLWRDFAPDGPTFADLQQLERKVYVFRQDTFQPALRHGLRFLVGCYKRQRIRLGRSKQYLEMLPTDEFLQRYLIDDYWTRVKEHVQQLDHLTNGKYRPPVNGHVASYNAAIEQTCGLVVNRDVNELYHLPEEFDQLAETSGQSSSYCLRHEHCFPRRWRTTLADTASVCRLKTLFEGLRLINLPEPLIQTMNQNAHNKAHGGPLASKQGAPPVQDKLREYLLMYPTLRTIPELKRKELAKNLTDSFCAFWGCSFAWIPFLHMIAAALVESASTRLGTGPDMAPPNVFYCLDEFDRCLATLPVDQLVKEGHLNGTLHQPQWMAQSSTANCSPGEAKSQPTRKYRLRYGKAVDDTPQQPLRKYARMDTSATGAFDDNTEEDDGAEVLDVEAILQRARALLDRMG